MTTSLNVGCGVQLNTWFSSLFSPKPPPRLSSGLYQRDHNGIVYVTAPDYASLGCGVGLSQVDDYGLELQLAWTLYSDRPSALLDSGVMSHLLPGQVQGTILQFDAQGFPKPSRLKNTALSVTDIERANHYIGFQTWTAETWQRIQQGQSGPLKDYLVGFAECANRRFAERRQDFLASTDPRIQYFVSRGLHTRTVTPMDPIAGAAMSMSAYSQALYQIWTDYVDAVPPVQQQARVSGGLLDPPRFTASNELGVSGRAMISGAPATMLDPHLPINGPYDQRKMPVHLRIPGEIEIDAGLAFGAAWPTIGHARHLKFGTAVSFTGTSNAHTPSNCWFAPTTADLSQYSTHLSNNQLVPFSVQTIDGVQVRESNYGRLIGFKADRGLGFLMKIAADGKHTLIETLWALFHARNTQEFRAGLDLKQLPYWHITAAFSSRDASSRLLYISNQVSAVRNPNPDGNAENTLDWNTFVPADDPRFAWSGQLHTAAELPQREIGMSADDPLFIHCHNCSAEIHSPQSVARPYLMGGYMNWTNPRQKMGSIAYAEAISQPGSLNLEDLIPLANHKRDLNLEEIVSKMDATLRAFETSLPAATRTAAANEISRWTSGPVLGTFDNPRIARVLYWQYLMLTSGTPIVGIDLMRLIHAYIGPGEDAQFNPLSPLNAADAGPALEKLAQVNLTFGALFGGDDQPWSQIQLFRTPFGAFPVSGSPHALMSLGGFFVHDSQLSRTILDALGGQNFVLLSEVGRRSLIRTSMHGTTRTDLPYTPSLTVLYAAEQFVPMGIGQPALSDALLYSSESFVLSSATSQQR